MNNKDPQSKNALEMIWLFLFYLSAVTFCVQFSARDGISVKLWCC